METNPVCVRTYRDLQHPPVNTINFYAIQLTNAYGNALKSR